MASLPNIYNVTEQMGWNQSIAQLTVASSWAVDARLMHTYWEPRSMINTPVQNCIPFTKIRSLTLSGNDVLSLLRALTLPNLREITLILTTEQKFPAEPVHQSRNASSRSFRNEIVPKAGIAPKSYYRFLIEFMQRSTKTWGPERVVPRVTIKDPLILDEDIAFILSSEVMRQRITELTIQGPRDIAQRLSNFFSRPDALKLLGGKGSKYARPIKLWFLKTRCNDDLHEPHRHETRVGWGVEPDDVNRHITMMVYLPGKATWQNGRNQIVLG